MKKIVSIGLIITAILSFSFTDIHKRNFQVGDWVILGQRVVNFSVDHDEILVTAKRGTFKKIKFKVVGSPVYVHNFKVIYGNGSSENFVINRHFKAGHESRVIDLKGYDRIIKKININYKTVRIGDGKAKVIVFGKH